MPAHADPSAGAGRPPCPRVADHGGAEAGAAAHVAGTRTVRCRRRCKQTPSTQFAAGALDGPAAPGPVGEQRHAGLPPSNQSPAAQSPLLAQLPRHAVGPQDVWSARLGLLGRGQRPAPSQAAARRRHSSAAAGPAATAPSDTRRRRRSRRRRDRRRPTRPRHMPGGCPCGAPSQTGAQTPALPGTSQAWHWPLATPGSQQTPSAQKSGGRTGFAPPQITARRTSFGVQIPAAQKLAPRAIAGRGNTVAAASGWRRRRRDRRTASAAPGSSPRHCKRPQAYPTPALQLAPRHGEVG